MSNRDEYDNNSLTKTPTLRETISNNSKKLIMCAVGAGAIACAASRYRVGATSEYVI